MSRYVIDKKALDENIELVKQKAGVPVIGVVKGNGYGFGIKEFAAVLKEHGIKTFAVTEVTDIAELKEVLDGEDILVMRSTCVESEAEIIAKNGCTATIGSVSAAKVMSKVSERLGVTTKCHLKIDTGMGRYGFMPSEIEDAIGCYSLPNLKFTGMYTHFSSAFRNRELTKAQLVLFRDAAEQIKKAVGEVGVIHAANSPALLNVEDVCLDSVRIGSAFTGRVITRSKSGLNRLGVLEAEVVDTKVVPKGYSIGYNGLYTTKRETKIAIVPIGHYDGFGLGKEKELYDFRYVLSVFKRFLKKQQMYVRINGEMHYVIGGIGLSHTAVDITGTDIKPGDIATVDISPLMVNPRVPRVYR
ncbi:MAG: alanine racemase [Ruminococcaceae bacterium]|nr:alanine racemase [Oscillospiraceae bacterium]